MSSRTNFKKLELNCFVLALEAQVELKEHAPTVDSMLFLKFLRNKVKYKKSEVNCEKLLQLKSNSSCMLQ